MQLQRRNFLEVMMAGSALTVASPTVAGPSEGPIDCMSSLVLFDPEQTAGELFAKAGGCDRQALGAFIENPDKYLQTRYQRVIGLSQDADAMIVGTLLAARGFTQTHRAEHVRTDAGVLHRLDSCNNSSESALATGEAAQLWPGLLARALLGERSQNPAFVPVRDTLIARDIPLVSWAWERVDA